MNMNRAGLSDKDRNQLQVLNALIGSREISAIDVTAKTKLSPATVSRIFKSLQEKDLIRYIGKEKTGKGRSPELFCFNGEYGYLLHYNITPMVVYGYIANLNGTVLGRYSVKYDPQGTLEQLLVILENIKNELLRDRNQRNKGILAADFAVPGVINKNQRTIHTIPDVCMLSDTKLIDYAERILGVPVIANNVSWLSAVGEKAEVYPFVENLVYIMLTSSMGIGMGVIVNNKLVTGNKNYAGEIGQTASLGTRSMEEYISGKGQVEHLAGLQMLIEKAQSALAEGKASILKNLMEKRREEKITLALLEEAAKHHDKDIEIILEETIKMWAMLAINVDLMINPEIIVLGGSISKENQYICNALDRQFSQLGLFKPEIRYSICGENAQLLGGIQMLKEYVHDNIILQEVIQ
ncbi:ROK family transcriptional regulator [Christensenella hongkongensis]|uniref:Xylose-responsive transcription regulator, ROK family n=1 Tax=Christensenella hongkongensis TaxID=270498 RepID=A0A0M2NKG4_9FIRM|nr:ROK family transcriptional regulator [Christensenella hongkongensis]KKI50942.1 Xylose-responsive transcription regulator, ROK family [Christensenella hongkongensis]TCW30626.1 MarR family transcriptional regulator [Christensenella hongkongensis]